MDVMRKLKPCPICGSHRKCFDIMGDLITCIGSPNGEIQLAGYKYCHPDKGQRYGIYEVVKGGSNNG